MKLIARYKLEGKEGRIPDFIVDGGYFHLKNESIGVTVDSEERHIPSTVVIMSRADIVSRLVSLGSHPHQNRPLTQSEAQAIVEAFLAEKGMQDYE